MFSLYVLPHVVISHKIKEKKMKKHTVVGGLCLLAIAFSVSVAMAGNGRFVRGDDGPRGAVRAGAMDVSALPYEELSSDEVAALTYMIEEEKVARDVYQNLYAANQIVAFANIAVSEQRHMDAIAALLDKYALENPVAGLDSGVFASEEFQNLYNGLVTAGAVNDEEALLVGATIEDLDIMDLHQRLENVDNQDITQVFGNLQRGSENHLRAFTSLLLMYGYEPYIAQYLSQDDIDAIIIAGAVKGSRRNASSAGGSTFVDSNGDGICDNLPVQ